MKKALVFEAPRTGYGIDQVERSAVTVGDLIRFLQDFDEDDPVILSHDRGYTYGSINLYEAQLYFQTEDGGYISEDELEV